LTIRGRKLYMGYRNAKRRAASVLAGFVAFLITCAAISAGNVLHAAESGEADVQRPYIAWTFTTYSEPSFLSEPLNRYSPQFVTVLESNHDGWVLIATHRGAQWVFLEGNRRYIDRRTALYDNIDDAKSIASISPQVVKILRQEGSWLLIDTWLGAKWINPDSRMPMDTEIAKLDAFMKTYGSTLSVYYENHETGYVYSHNDEQVYFGASVIKAPYALFVYELAEKGLTNLSEKLVYQESDFWGASGSIQKMKFGTALTVQTVLQHVIRESDNAGLRMLSRRYGKEPFKKFVAGLGVDANRITSVAGATMSAHDAGLYAKAIYQYLESGGQYSQQFKTDLMSTVAPSKIVSDFPIAHKYGWAQKSFHDMAIVYSDSPYTLVIMSEREYGSAKDHEAFRAISMFFQEFNERNFTTPAR